MLKIYFIIAIYFLVHVNLFAQKNPTTLYRTVAIDNSTSMDMTEVTIQQWIYFIINNDFNANLFPNANSISNSAIQLFDDLKKGNNFEYIEIIKNNGIIKKNFGEKGFRLTKRFEIITANDTNYFSTNIPIVGVTFEQAKLFCEWKEELVNKTKNIKVTISLASIELYNKVNANKDSVCKKELNCKVCTNYQLNYFHNKCIEQSKHNEEITQGKGLLRVDSYWPCILGLYNIQGNAAEMTSTKGIAIGGSFRHFAIESYSNKVQEYNKPEDWLGFRCLVTLK
jgi:formylglycine-generating enzyme required for sulfatase activity